jgi:hypothetical protein
MTFVEHDFTCISLRRSNTKQIILSNARIEQFTVLLNAGRQIEAKVDYILKT